MAEPGAIERLRRVLVEEAAAIERVAARLDGAFSEAVDRLLGCGGRVVCCGLGKSGHVAAKAAATFASTGTPAFFLHAAEALHGDLGMVGSTDVLVAYSYSGETDEIVRVLQSAPAESIVLTGRPGSSAARAAGLALDVAVDAEACPNNLAPTTSTTVMLAVSDALAVAVMEARGFGPEDFARFHPAGALGRRLTLRVRDVMRQGEDLPLVPPSTPILETLQVVTRLGAGGACVVGPDGVLLGFLSDGDIRRWFLRSPSPLEGTAGEAMTPSPTTVEPDLLAAEALEAFQNFPRKIGEMPVVERGAVVGLLTLKDLLRSGLL